jgi:TolB-like protein
VPAPPFLPDSDSRPSVAVLPLRDIGGDPSNEYFSEGMTDDIITHLAKVGGLRVISRTSVMSYKGSDKPLRQIADELGATALLEGSVRRADGQVRIVAQLVDARTDASLWADTYDRRLEDVFAIQSEVAQHIAEALRATLSPTTRERIASRPTADTVAYELYLQGRFHWNRRSVPDLERAITFFEAAIARDSAFAHAWAGLADSYMMLPFYSPAPPREWIPRARQAAEHALGLNPDLAEARTTLAYALALHDWDWEAADREFRRAQELSPSYSTAYKWHSDILSIMGRPAEALAAVERALALDPLSPNVRTILGLKHWYAGDVDVAMAHFERALELDPRFPLTLEYVSQIYWNRGDTARFFAAREKLDDTFERVGVPVSELREVFAVGGPEAVLRHQVSAPDADRLPTERARWHTLLGDLDRALADLDQAYEERTVWLPFMPVHPDLAPLRRDPRYRSLVRRIGLE